MFESVDVVVELTWKVVARHRRAFSEMFERGQIDVEGNLILVFAACEQELRLLRQLPTRHAGFEVADGILIKYYQRGVGKFD